MSIDPHTDLRRVEIAAIQVPPWRLRALGDTDALRESIATTGLLQPVVLDASLTLVCGLHRLEACRALGWKHIPAYVQPLDGPKAQLAEVDENLCRRELTVLERAEHIALRRKLWEEMNPPPAADTTRKKPPKRPEAPLTAFVDDTAKKTGRAAAAVREELRIGELPEDVRATARETNVRDSKKELLALTRMPEEEQRRAVAAVKAGEAKSVRKKPAKPEAPAPTDTLAPPEGPTDAPLLGGDLVEAAPDPWLGDGNAFMQERARAEIVRLVGEAQRALARTVTLWSASHDEEGRARLDDAVRAVERLTRWMESGDAERHVA
mgnify:CR=1 FL=1